MKQPKLDEINVSTKQALGVFFIALSLFTYLGGLAWFSAYWDNELVETYRDYDIYYFPNINVYGIDVGTEPQDWPFNTGLQGCRNKIDLFVDCPETLETYRDFTIYKLPGYNLYWGENTEDKTNTWDNLTSLKTLIDLEYYPNLIYTIHSDLGDFGIYQQGYFNPVYWGMLDGYQTLEYDQVSDAKQAVRDYIEEKTEEIPAPGDETTGDPIEEPGEEYTGNADPDETVDTIGDRLNAQKNLISGISATIGIGLVAIDYGARRDE